MEETRKGVEGKRVGEEKIKTWRNIRDGRKDRAKWLFLSVWSRNFWKTIRRFPRKQWNYLWPLQAKTLFGLRSLLTARLY